MPPAARATDLTIHGSPLAPGPGSANVMIGGVPAWRAVVDQHTCPAISVTGADGVGTVIMGSPTVFINNMMACRMGDIVAEKPGLALGPANPIVIGCPTVIIGEVGMGSAIAPEASQGMINLSSNLGGEAGRSGQALAAASQNGAAIIFIEDNSSLMLATGANATPAKRKTWIEIELLKADGMPVPYERYRIVAPDGEIVEGCTDGKGLARLSGIDPGTCNITFPTLDKEVWRDR
jgi:uncharacterized Zn-binding protein involved in type VI secretion